MFLPVQDTSPQQDRGAKTGRRGAASPSLAKRCLPLLLATLGATSLHAQRLVAPAEEFVERRARLCAQLGGGSAAAAEEPTPARIEQLGTALLFATSEPDAGVRLRQDHDFFYLTGNEDKNAILALEVASCRAWLFLPPQTAREASRDGWNWLYQEDAAERWGFEQIHPLHYFDEFLARRRVPGPQKLWVRLSERDLIDQSRTDAALFFARRLSNPWAGQPSEDAWRIARLRERYPHYELRDVTPAIDELRMQKTRFEVEALRRAGEISARAIARSIAATAPGVWEYEIEAEATHEMIQSGAEWPAYPAIVGSGPNGIVWHYNRSDRQMQAGDLVVMDYGASVAYQTMDITRTWPVSGRFTELQERAYRAVLEAQKAILAAMRPGVTREATRQVAREVYERHGFDADKHFPGGAGHFVGMAVHDVGDYHRPLEAGMVIAVEPIIEIPEEDLHIRIEDTVLVTEDGTLNLSAGVPKEIDELLALVGRDAKR
ncbi:MAG: aminopeptidase P family protein [Acidobacteria bacterium]|nr:MAG: aminopeptidase P family protein [Acidobacteriota bacterium]REK11262.1 MAG: aminopeptidase P family protein [Acidobacteriota bacterium]